MARITVEDCLKKEENRFKLVLLAIERAKQLIGGAKPLFSDETRNDKEAVIALREIAEGLITAGNIEEKEREAEEFGMSFQFKPKPPEEPLDLSDLMKDEYEDIEEGEGFFEDEGEKGGDGVEEEELEEDAGEDGEPLLEESGIEDTTGKKGPPQAKAGRERPQAVEMADTKQTVKKVEGDEPPSPETPKRKRGRPPKNRPEKVVEGVSKDE